MGCGLQARSEGGTWSTVSPVLLWSRLPSPRFPHCQHPFLFLFLSIPQSYFCTGEKRGGCMASARATPGRDRKSICPFYCPTALTCGKVGTLLSGAAACVEHTWNLDQGGPETLAHSPVKWCHGALIKILACLFPPRCAPTVSPSSKTL